ncbi:hypothetical protein [Sediminibacterium sp.]|uniref:hypothetical protein n=1 Tax=Sediminibacterium sp. TaxID=1917865 RepID=UPI00272662B7|nr:hypothetical protein [Sediminibacterium sp.]MDO8996396.1 hypothetical protein [Sediminibacterium sp.]MDP1971436.1 hypothetical protein [Sediminibacterium sp.]MDP2420136.1 hypothetical protein [Sediminibacterium sp.]
MKNIFSLSLKGIALSTAFAAMTINSNAQTDMDALMMAKNNFCSGLMFGNSTWKNYWEGTLKRDNQNLGTVSSQMVGIMGNYGIKDNLNILFSVPYFNNKASAGTLIGRSGIQDLTLTLKWMPIETTIGKADFALYALGSYSTPLTNYVKDYLPLSIGLGSNTAMVRLMADYQLGNFFTTASAAFFSRSNVTIDRTAYYTTRMHYTNQVEMPTMSNFNFRAGYRSGKGYGEAIVDIMQTNGGFDMTRNNMPFLSNQMNASRVGFGFKYNFGKVEGLSAVGNAMYTIAGRNMGQATSISAGMFYILDFSKSSNNQNESDENK